MQCDDGASELAHHSLARRNMQQLGHHPNRTVDLQRRHFGRVAAASAMCLSAAVLPAHAQFFGRTAGLAPLLLGAGLPQPPSRAFELTGRTALSQRLVLGSFTVSVVQQHVRLVPAKGVAVGIAATATQFADLQLAGLDNMALQAACDTVYAAWLDAGRSMGLDIVSPQAMLASAAWPNVRASGQSSGIEQSDRGIVIRNFAPQGLVVQGIGQVPADSGLPLPSGGLADSLARVQGQAREVAALARAARSGQSLELLAKELGAQLMSVRLVLGFVEVKDELAGHPHLLSVGDSSTRLGLYLDARNSQVVLSAPDNEDSRTVKLRLPFMLPEPALQGIESALPDAVDTSRAVVEALARWRGAVRTTRHVVQADGPAYARQTAAALASLAPAMFKALAAG